ncbi:MAG: glycosyl hydrolase [Melioribacteraceae bacterium]|nr:glycosyl hydrolase [Melioribacteraceae bacterium]
MRIIRISISLLSLLIILSCSQQLDERKYQISRNVNLVNRDASFNTTNLFFNLKNLAQSSIIFGHHHSTFYGIGWRGDEDRSDVKDVAGAHPGLIGWDFEDFVKIGDEKYHNLRQMVIAAHEKGIVNAFCWHYSNPVTGGTFYDTTVVVNHLLPGGSHNGIYNKELDRIANFTKQLVGTNGKVIPIIFRPFHEMDGNWFWWGRNFCTSEEFILLWRYTVAYLKDYRKVKNVLFAFSPDRNFDSDGEYFTRYPGDEYVDILGVDNYWDFSRDGEGREAVKKKLKIITHIAARKGKISAFTETGLERIPDNKWWTDKLLYAISDDSIKISFVMVWRNVDKNHHYAPYKGHSSSPDFIEFKNNYNILFADNLPDLFAK